MVLDTSALTAILFDETDAKPLARAVERAQARRLFAANRVEVSLVVEGRKGDAGRADLGRFLAEA